MTGEDDPSDEDRAALEQMLRNREAQRARAAAAGPRPPAAPGAMAERWARETFGGDDDAGDDEGVNAPLPRTTPVGIVATAADDVVLYRDGRCRFSIAIPGDPGFVAAGGGLDATCTLAAAPITVSLVMLPPQPDAPLAAQVEALAADITQAPPAPLTVALPGVEVAVTATLTQGDEVRAVAVLGGGAADSRAIVIVMLDHDRRAVDDATAATVRAAVLGSAAFLAEPRRRVPRLLPDSPWLEPGLPLRPRAGHPALPALAGDRGALAAALLALAGDSPPSRPLDDAARAAATARLGGAVAALTTAHDLRGLAAAVRAA
ncbi:MAG: hypothetical protein KJZ91_29845 [Myxococcales bacterium]|nr:hypothetical protein [Myxococcales bacterium]